jgi:uncharacterized protein (TIGR03118 family)
MRKILLFAGLGLAVSHLFAANSYTVHNLASDIPNPPGTNDANFFVDADLVDPWGIALGASVPFWLSNAGTGLATVYTFTNNVIAKNANTRVSIPSASGGPARVTGQIAGGGLNFGPAGGPFPSFMFCTEDGTISVRVAPNNNTTALITVNNAGSAVYKGCTATVTPDGPRFYAANFKAGTVDVFDNAWQPVPGGFTDPNLPAGMNPFNVQALGNKIVVTYAMLGPDGVSDQPGRGNGVVDIYDYSGNLMLSFTDGSMNSPWGVAIAPEFFGDFSFALLVGNFGDGRINAFDTMTGAYLGTLSDSTGKPLALEGLWGLQFGNGRNGGDAKTLYFSAGISGGVKKEAHGLFGSITTP